MLRDGGDDVNEQLGLRDLREQAAKIPVVPNVVGLCFPVLGAFVADALGGAAWVWALSPSVLAVWGTLAFAGLGPARATLVAAACGTVLGVLAAPGAWDRPRSISWVRDAPVAINGTVRRVTTSAAGAATVTVGPCSVVWPEGSPPPWPGSQIEALGRYDGHTLRVLEPGGASQTSPPQWHPAALLERLRRAIRDRVGAGLTPETAAALRSLLLGDPLPRERRKALADTGTLHFFAVSGLHLALLANLVIRSVGPRGHTLLPVLTLYAGLTGFGTPVGRALMMVLGVLGARTFRRAMDPHRHLLLTLTTILVLRPEHVASAGLLLSFSAYAGILTLALPTVAALRADPFHRLASRRGMGRARAWIRDTLIVSAAAWLGSLPATWMLFHRVTPVAVLGSVAIGPLMGPLLMVAALKAAAPQLPGVSWAAESLMDLLDAIVWALESVPWGTVDVPAPRGLGVAVSATLLVGAATLGPRGGAHRARAWTLAALAPVALTLLPLPQSPGFSALPAGRGLAVLVTTPDGTDLIDAGPPDAHIASKLLRRGVSRLRTLIFTHSHADHAGGGPDVRRRLDVHQEQRCPPGATVLAPEVEGIVPMPHSNDESLVIAVQGRRRRLIVSGDLETPGLRRALRGKLGRTSADTLVLPHHGARNDAAADLLLATRPDRSWLSARPGFPDEGIGLIALWAGVPTFASWTHPLQVPDR